MARAISQSSPLAIDSERYYQVLAAATPVSLIQTEVKNLHTCTFENDIEAVLSREELAEFDRIPVLQNGAIVGVLEREGAARSGKVGAHYRTLHPDILIGEAAPIFKFIERADRHHFCFVVGRDGISGIVTISDLQKLPVQVALFGLIAQFEHLVGELLRQRLKDADQRYESVLTHLDDKDVKRVRSIKKMNDKRNLSIDWITPLSLTQTVGALRAVDQNAFLDWNQVNKICDLRNSIAHNHGFAQTFDLLNELVNTKRNLYDYVIELTKKVAKGK